LLAYNCIVSATPSARNNESIKKTDRTYIRIDIYIYMPCNRENAKERKGRRVGVNKAAKLANNFNRRGRNANKYY